MKKIYFCFDCRSTMIRVGLSLVCSNTTCGRKWTPKHFEKSYSKFESNYQTTNDTDDKVESLNAEYFDETDGYGDDPEMGYYNIHGEMPPPGWGRNNNNDDEDY